MSGFQQTVQMLNEGIVPHCDAGCQRSMALGRNARHYRSGLRVGADISVVGMIPKDSSCYIRRYTPSNRIFTVQLEANQRGTALLQLSPGPGGETEISCCPSPLVKKKNHPSAQYAKPLSPRALADSLMRAGDKVSDWEAGSEGASLVM